MFFLILRSAWKYERINEGTQQTSPAR